MGPIDGRFAVARVLGEGGMGEAVLAHDRDRTPVVVKLLHKKHASRPDFLERFRREIRALEKLRHAHIVSLLGSGFCAERGQPYYVMEFSTGVALDVLVRRTPFNMARTLRLTCQVLDGLAFAHEAGIIHRDLKPQNVFVEMPGTLEESARIIDFGLAKHLAGGERTAKPITAPGQMLGTPTYTAPEQLRGEPPVLATDIYSIGCILMELLTGSPPFPEPRLRYLIQKHLRQAPPRLDTRREAPSELVDLLDECLRKAPDERPSAPELRQRLDAIRGRFEASTARVLAAAGPAPGAGASIADVATRGGLEPADAVRAKLDFTHEKRTERVFLFAGAQLRFGRGTERGGKRTTDLVLRSFPRVGEAGSLASKRSLEVSRWHGTFLVTGEGIAVRDEGSKTGTTLDGAPLPRGKLAPLPREFTLEIGGTIPLRGRLLEARGPLLPELSLGGDFPESPLAALLLERADEGCDHRYLVLLRSVSLGSGEDDDLRLSFPGLKRGQARLAVNGERFLIAATRVVRTGRLLPLEAYVPLEPGKRLRLGPVEVAFSPAGDDDMKPGSPDGDLERGP